MYCRRLVATAAPLRTAGTAAGHRFTVSDKIKALLYGRYTENLRRRNGNTMGDRFVVNLKFTDTKELHTNREARA